MAIKYALYENNLTTDPADFAAQVKISSTATAEDIANRMIEQGSTTTKADILAVLEDLAVAVGSLLQDGRSVNVGEIVNFQPRVIGVFNGPNDVFDPLRHRVDVVANPGTRIRTDFVNGVTVEKVAPEAPEPQLVEYHDLASNTTNSTVTRGTIGTISGSRLKYNTAQADEGIFLVPTGAGAVVKVANASVQTNKPGKLIFLVPTGPGLPVGTYFLEVRARIAGGVNLRTGRLEATLTVV